MKLKAWDTALASLKQVLKIEPNNEKALFRSLLACSLILRGCSSIIKARACRSLSACSLIIKRVLADH
jgi:hypothetical protein